MEKKHLIDRDRFTFYKSYYDTYKELPIKDRPEFIETIMAVYFLEKKLEDVKPSTPMLKLAFSSISHSIKTSIKGLFDKLGIDYNSYPYQGAYEGACQQHTISNKQQAIDNKKQEINIPTYAEFEIYALSKEPLLAKKGLKLKYDAWLENGWKNGYNKPIQNWKTTLLNTIPHLAKEVKESCNDRANRVF